MAISRFSTSSVAQGLPRYQKLWDGISAVNNNSFESISTVTVGSGGVLSVTFSSIPQTYKHLQIRAVMRDNRSNSGGGSYGELTFNGDTTSNYAYHQLLGYGTATASASNSNQTAIEFTRLADAGSTSGVFGVATIDIPDYTSTSRTKTVRGLGGYDTNGNGSFYLWSGLWFKTPEAITSITFKDAGGTLLSQYSQFALYGIKG